MIKTCKICKENGEILVKRQENRNFEDHAFKMRLPWKN